MQHIIADSDKYFEIDPVTRLIKPKGEKTSIVQFDHNSERLTFSIPRYVEGYDMTKCTNIEVHYANTDADTKDENIGVYPITDIQIDPNDTERAICTWLISQNATQKVGLLKFSVRFTCVDKDANVLYSWNTAIFSSIIVLASFYNSNQIAEEYADILAEWKKEFDDTIGTIAPYIGENGNWTVYDTDAGKFVDTDINAQGLKGDKGEKGEPGAAPYIGENGNWYVWSAEAGAYIDTGVFAKGVKPIFIIGDETDLRAALLNSTDNKSGVIHVTRDYQYQTPEDAYAELSGQFSEFFGRVHTDSNGKKFYRLVPAIAQYSDYVFESSEETDYGVFKFNSTYVSDSNGKALSYRPIYTIGVDLEDIDNSYSFALTETQLKQIGYNGDNSDMVSFRISRGLVRYNFPPRAYFVIPGTNNQEICRLLTEDDIAAKNDVSTENPEILAVNTIYDLGIQSALTLNLPSGEISDFIQVDFLSGETPTTLVITSANGLSEYDLIPRSNMIYSLYFDWGVLYYDETASAYVYGWRFAYAEYVAAEV